MLLLASCAQAVVHGWSAPRWMHSNAVDVQGRMRHSSACCSLESVASDNSALVYWPSIAACPRYPRLRDISQKIRVLRTVSEAELAIKLEGEYANDQSLLLDIDFRSLAGRLKADIESATPQVEASGLLSREEVEALFGRQRNALDTLLELAPKYDSVETAIPVPLPLHLSQKIRFAIDSIRFMTSSSHHVFYHNLA